ncbi:helix-turn-helix domain-containing protein [Streptomyces mirabilis]|uniref:helix-turn-helix domain-containing protein n=1 Tax=Streptomyces mirabilis TaxID=68239 RepID=UPI00367591FE
MRCAEGGTNQQAAADLGIDRSTVDRWRARFIAKRLDGLHDEPRSGRPPSILLDQVEKVVVATLESLPGPVRPQSPTCRTPSSCPPARSSSPRSSTLSACTTTRPRRRSCSAWTRRARSRRRTGPSRCCRACPNGVPTTIRGTASPACSPPSTSPRIDKAVPAGLDVHLVCDN